VTSERRTSRFGIARTAHAGLFSVSRGAFPDLVVGDDPFG
jgi:hypothetical protein